MRPSRREFVKWVAASGIALSLSRLGASAPPGFPARPTLPGRGNFNPAANGAGRIDGVAKATGAKLYASDFRAADLPGWPSATSHAILVRAPDARHVYLGMDLTRLDGAAKPSVVVTAEELAKIGVRVPEFYAGDLFCPVGRTPIYMGQPVALLIFEQFDAFDQARLGLRDGTFVKFGEETDHVVMPDYGAYRFTRVAGPTAESPDVYSPLQAGWVSPGRIQASALPVWSSLAKETLAPYGKAAVHGERIRSPDSFAGIAEQDGRSAAIFTELGKVLTHPRCMNCHPAGDRPRQGEGTSRRLHQPPVARGADGHGFAAMQCSICHGNANFEPGHMPGHPEWHLAPREMGWEGKTLAEICEQLRDPARNGGRKPEDLIHHIGEDTLVGWAWHPGFGRSPVPGTQKQAGALVAAWVRPAPLVRRNRCIRRGRAGGVLLPA
jgi:hypothetical protein